jgi:hypothetical protein
VATTAVLPLLPEKPLYLKLGAYPKYGDFTLLFYLPIIVSGLNPYTRKGVEV